MAEEKGFEELLPWTIMATVLSKLDVRSLCASAATCKTLRSCAVHTLSFLPSLHLTDIAPDLDLLRPLMPPNPHLLSLKLDCARLDDSSISHVLRPSLQELYLHNCHNFSGRLLSHLGTTCRELRCLYLSSLAERRRLLVQFSDLEELLGGCSHLESLSLALDVTVFDDPKFAEVWAVASVNLIALEIAYIPLVMLTRLLTSIMESQHPRSHLKQPILPSLQKLCLTVDYITDPLLASISEGLPSLTHIDLQDAPMSEPSADSDLTNNGLQQINPHGRLKHLSLARSQDYLPTHFRRVNDLGILLMAEACFSLESINLGGFCRVTDTGFRAILHSCPCLSKLRVFHGSQLTDLVFHDISATSLSLTHVSLRWCNRLTNIGIVRLSCNTELSTLDLQNCRNLGDGALYALSSLPKLKTLFLDNSNISDTGLSYLGFGKCRLLSLSLRGCKRLTNACISSIFSGPFGSGLQVLDLSKIPNLSDDGIFSLAKSRVPIAELRIRECPHVGDSSVMALASMQIEGGSHGSSLHLLDLYECGGITSRAFRWFKKPYFPRLRCLGVTGSMNRDLVDALARNRPFLEVERRGEELGNGIWDSYSGWNHHEEDELDEFEQWLLESGDEAGEDGADEDDMGE